MLHGCIMRLARTISTMRVLGSKWGILVTGLIVFFATAFYQSRMAGRRIATYITPTEAAVRYSSYFCPGEPWYYHLINRSACHQICVFKNLGFRWSTKTFEYYRNPAERDIPILVDGQATVTIGANTYNSVTVIMSTDGSGSGNGYWITSQYA